MSKEPSTTFPTSMDDWVGVVRRLAPTLTYRIWFGAVAVAGVVVCTIPLFNLVGYESAALFGATLGPVVAFLTLHAFRRGIVPEPLATERSCHPADAFAALAVRHVALLVPPLAALLLNALRVQNCALGTGALFWLTIPVASVLLGQTCGWLVAAAVPADRWLRNLVLGGLVVASAVLFGLRLAWQPPIVGHQLFLGYFSGSIYDEALALPTSLVAYRAMNVSAAVAALAAVECLRLRRAGRSARWEMAVAAVAVGSFVTLITVRKDLGVGIDRRYIQQELGGRLETEHFVIHYPQRQRFAEQLDRLAEDHEFRYAEMRRFFETDPASDGKLHSYVYPDREVKNRLMGARSTLVAKLWLGEIHILWNNYGDHLLAHELAHLFTEPFGAGPLRLSVQNGVGVNMGLVEGIATAADWPVQEMTPHQAAAALHRLEMATSIRDVVGASGFWTRAAGRAYTLVGSFIRYLVDEYGIERFKRAYPHGDFRTAYDVPLGDLIDEWRQFLEGFELSETALETARYRYRRPSIFRRVCPRTTAEVRRRARLAAARGDTGGMRRFYRRLVGYAPENVDYRIEFARRLVRTGQVSAGLKMVHRQLEADLPPVQRTRLLELRGDARWHRGRPERAATSYRKCLDIGVPLDRRRLLLVKRASLASERRSVRSLAFDYLIGDVPSAISLYAPMAWVRRRPDDAVGHYLVGRRLWQHRRWERATEHLRRAHGRLEPDALRGEAGRMLGRSLYFSGATASAARIFERLAQSPVARYREEAREWLARIDWRRRGAGDVE